jgi:hypothetical protein
LRLTTCGLADENVETWTDLHVKWGRTTTMRAVKGSETILFCEDSDPVR